jgi:hypothetical protein
MEAKEVGETVQRGVMSFLSNKPVWAFWIVYSALSGILFGVFYAAMYFMALRWWIPIIAIIAVGTIWGSIAYAGKARSANNEEKAAKKEA